MKDGRTHLAHKAEHAVDLETGAIVAVTVQGADQGDTTTMPETLAEAAEQLDRWPTADGEPVALVDEVVADKGYHSRAVVLDLNTLGFRTYIAEPDRGAQRGSIKRTRATRCMAIVGASAATAASGCCDAAANASNAALPMSTTPAACGARICAARTNILKRVLVHASGFNLGLVMRRLLGVGTPRGFQGRLAALIAVLVSVYRAITGCHRAIACARHDRWLIARLPPILLTTGRWKWHLYHGLLKRGCEVAQRSIWITGLPSARPAFSDVDARRRLPCATGTDPRSPVSIR